jgi:hypothetical protein
MHRTASSGPLAAALVLASSTLLAQGVHRTDPGTQTGERFGAAIAALGDLDRDGVVDYAIGAPGFGSPGLPGRGRVSVRSGATGAELYAILGPRADMEFGAAIAALGDVTGDRVPDFAVGAPGDANDAGFVSVRSGLTGAEVIGIAGIGGVPGARFGAALARIGDVDGDGIDDLVVGAPSDDPLVQSSLAVHCLPGGVAPWVLFGSWQEHLGASMASLGDVDGDGLADVAVGLVGEQPAAVSQLFRLSPRGNGSVTIHAIWSLPERCFDCVAAAGDLDGDGRTEVLAASPERRVLVLQALGLAAVREVLPPRAGEGFGTAVAGIGDRNGDGVPDYAVGAPLAASGAGRAYVYDGATGVELTQVDGAAGDGLGAAFAVLPDLDGDRAPEWAVARPAALGSAVDSGAVDVRWSPRLGAFAVLGTGCPGPNGVPTVLGIGSPVIGSTVQIRGRQLPPFGSAISILGLSDTSSGGVPLPLALGPFGFAGCSLYVSADVVGFTTTNSNGTAVRSVAVPNTFALLDVSLFAQFAGLVGTGTLVFTPGLQARLGR